MNKLVWFLNGSLMVVLALHPITTMAQNSDNEATVVHINHVGNNDVLIIRDNMNDDIYKSSPCEKGLFWTNEKAFLSEDHHRGIVTLQGLNYEKSVRCFPMVEHRFSHIGNAIQAVTSLDDDAAEYQKAMGSADWQDKPNMNDISDIYLVEYINDIHAVFIELEGQQESFVFMYHQGSGVTKGVWKINGLNHSSENSNEHSRNGRLVAESVYSGPNTGGVYVPDNFWGCVGYFSSQTNDLENNPGTSILCASLGPGTCLSFHMVACGIASI